MPNPTNTMPKNGYDPRWFIWTIVLLVVTGISLVSYIMLSDSGTNEVPDFAIRSASAKKEATSTPVKTIKK